MDSSSTNFAIGYRAIDKFFGRRHLLDDVAVSLEGGVAILLSGENGAGKTTLLRILSGLEKPARCLVDFNTGDLRAQSVDWLNCRKQLQRKVMYLHQQPYMFEGTVIDNLALALPRTMPKLQRGKKIRRAIEWAHLERHQHARAKNLSGGEKQRIALARAWLRQAKVLLLDEPIANMDRESQTRTVALLRRLKNTRAALMISSHNHEVFTELIDRRLVIENKKLMPLRATLPDNVTPLAKKPRARNTPAIARVDEPHR